MPPPVSVRVFNAIVWIIVIASAFYAASQHLTGKQHFAGAVAGIVVLVVMAIVINVISSRRRARSGRQPRARLALFRKGRCGAGGGVRQAGRRR